tara:strand:+ start:204 stop:1340 length:1137 start_codon:yes stop_codon:yes gene_type:complete
MANGIPTQNQTGSNSAPSRKPSYSAKLLIGFCIAIGIIGSGGAYQSFLFNKEMKNLSVKYQNLGPDEVLVTTGFSIKQNMMLKIKILSEINPRPEILFLGNHQLKYFGTSFSNTISTSKFFNLWLGNIGITEIADITSYLDRASLTPKKALVVMITTPNNDNGDNIIGYKGELPDEMYQLHKLGKNIGRLEVIQNKWRLGTLSYELDYKKIMGLINGLSIEIVPPTARRVSHFMILKNGAFAHDDSNYWNSPPIKNANPLEANKSNIKPHHIEEIRNSITYIDGIAKSHRIQAILVIPPVHEDLDRTSLADKILTEALDGLELSHTRIIDHRKIQEKTDPSFFFRYDHPNSKYGEQLYNEILSIVAENKVTDKKETIE